MKERQRAGLAVLLCIVVSHQLIDMLEAGTASMGGACLVLAVALVAAVFLVWDCDGE